MLSGARRLGFQPDLLTAGQVGNLTYGDRTRPPRSCIRTARAPFDACSSSIEQRPCAIRPGPAPPSDDTPYETRWRPWTWGPPERYCGSAGYRDDLRWRLEHQQRSLRPRRHICIPAYAGWLTVHARRHQREVCTLSGRVMLQPLSGPLQVGLRFLPDPLPAAPSAHLTTRFPQREGYGLTTLRH